MKANRLVWTFLLLTVAVVQVTAQETATDRRQFEETKAKAEKGDPQAQYWVGFQYFMPGATQNLADAVKWFRKAAVQGHAEAQSQLGVCLTEGCGVAKGAGEGVRWFRRAAEQGNVGAQDDLGFCYSEGKGVPKDYVEAHKWFNLASSGKYATFETFSTMDADEHLPIFKIDPQISMSNIEHLMAKEQIAEAQKLAREFKPRRELKPDTSGSPSRIIGSRPVASGTGFFITEDGFLATNEHVVRGATEIRLATSAGLISAKLVKVDAANDLALLKAEGRFAALPVAASRTVKLGGTMATVGFPNIGLQGFAPKLAKGEIASLSGARDDARYFQISVPVQPGNSGGALVDERGNVVGVVSAKLSARAALSTSGSLPENVNYAVKSSLLLSFLESVPDVSAKLKEPNTKGRKFEDMVKSAEQAAVLVLVY